MRNYYRYQGSLTTPTCNEVVVWTLFEEKNTISEYQVSCNCNTPVTSLFKMLHGSKVYLTIMCLGDAYMSIHTHTHCTFSSVSTVYFVNKLGCTACT